MTFSEDILNLARDATVWRREMHKNPQTAYEEEFASNLVQSKLQDWDIPFTKGIAKTGIVATLKGRNEGQGRSIGLRADMDALDIDEESGQPWSSEIPGKMHGCGHDGHTAMLLGAAKLLKDNPDFSGTVYFIFQPAEEGHFGAHTMISEGLFDRFPMDEIYALHTLPDIPVGAFATCPGMILGASDNFYVTLRSDGGHAALPHLSADPVIAAGHIIVSLQSIISRLSDPVKSAVISVTNINSGTGAVNVIPDRAEMSASVRFSDLAMRQEIERHVGKTVSNIADIYGLRAEIDYKTLFEPTVNTPRETQHAIAAARDITDENLVFGDYPPTMGGEDFSAMLMEKPGCYMYIGQGDPDDNQSPHNYQCHASRFDFNDRAIAYGIAFWRGLVKRRLS